MKKPFYLFMLMILPLLANAEEVQIGQLWYSLDPNSNYAHVISSRNEPYSGDVIIPDTITYEGVDYCVKYISSYAFESCPRLTSVSIPNSVTEIGERVFENCTALASVSIGSGLEYDYGKIFHGCTGLKTITLRRALPYDASDDFFDDDTFQSATLHVPTGRMMYFQDHRFWGKFATIVEEDMPDVKIDSSPFNNLYSRRMILSYTNGTYYGGSMGGNSNDYVIQAVKFPDERMTRIKGNKITHIRLMMWNRYEHISDMIVFIGSARYMRDLVCQPVTDLHEGWNEVVLDQPYTITGDSIVVGVGYYMGSDDFLYPVKWDPYAGQEEGACILFREGKWSTGEGTWFIQCMVEGDEIPKYDVHFEEFVEPLFKRIVKAGEPYEFSIKLRNWGSMSIDHYEMRAQLDGKDVECTSVWNQKIERGGGLQETGLQITTAEGMPVGKYQLSIVPKTFNGEEYAGITTPLESPLKIYEHDMGRQKILVQVYTGTWCGYCPEFDLLVEKKKHERGDLAVVDIHSMDHWYTTPASESYLSMMYSDGFPNVDLNRCVEKTQYNYREYIMNYCLDEAKAQPAFASVNIAGSYDEEEDILELLVSGERNEDFLPVEEWTNLTVLLVEDDIIGYQNGADDPSNFHHPAVLRTNISDIWGDPVEWDGDKYEMYYAISLNYLPNLGAAWNKDNMRVVAFLSKPFTGSNYEDIYVVNCNEISLNDLKTGIHNVNIGSAPTKVYDLSGRLISPNAKDLRGLPHGIYIIGGKKVVK